MPFSEYTLSRANLINKMNIPQTTEPFDIKTLWFDNIHSQHRDFYSVHHSHSFIEIHYVFFGEVSFKCEDENILLTANEALLIPSGVSHSITSGTAHFRISLAFTLGRGRADDLFPFDEYRKFAISDDICANARYILKKSETDDIFTPAIIAGRIAEIVYHSAIAMGIKPKKNISKSADTRVGIAKEYIENNRHRLISCEDVSKECGLSRKQLGRIFKKETGENLYDFVVNSKLRYAGELLARQSLSIKEIGYMMGFETESNFVNFFKRHSGISPGTYRMGNTNIKENR